MKNPPHSTYIILLIFLTIVDLLLLAYILFYPGNSSVMSFVRTFDIGVCILLWIEFIYSYLHSDDKKQFMKENAISILGMLPVDFIFLRALRLIRLIHLIKQFIVQRESEKTITNFLKQTYLDKIIFVAIIFIFTVTVLICIFDSQINDMQTAVWYIIVSMTSTGYGDVVPITIPGRILGIVAMIGGILIFAIITALMSSIYTSKLSKENYDNYQSQINELTYEIKKLNEKNDEMACEIKKLNEKNDEIK